MKQLFFDTGGRLRNGWWIAIFFLALAALVVPATIFAANRQIRVPFEWQALMVLAVSMLCAGLRREPISSFAGRLATWPPGLALGAVAGFCIWTTVAAVLWAAGSVTWQMNPDAGTALVAGIGGMLAVVVTEELMFRGFVFQRLIDGVGAWPAQILMAGYFLLTHWHNPQMAGAATQAIVAVNIFLAGLMFGAAYLRTRSLALPIALHFTLNFTQGSLLGFGVSGHAGGGVLVPHSSGAPEWWTGGAFGLEASVPGTVAIAVALVILHGWRRRADKS
ncbi:MAG: lysostaphin resistance A-like protein [Gammaproteobacteria bacterium]